MFNNSLLLRAKNHHSFGDLFAVLELEVGISVAKYSGILSFSVPVLSFVKLQLFLDLSLSTP